MSTTRTDTGRGRVHGSFAELASHYEAERAQAHKDQALEMHGAIKSYFERVENRAVTMEVKSPAERSADPLACAPLTVKAITVTRPLESGSGDALPMIIHLSWEEWEKRGQVSKKVEKMAILAGSLSEDGLMLDRGEATRKQVVRAYQATPEGADAPGQGAAFAALTRSLQQVAKEATKELAALIDTVRVVNLPYALIPDKGAAGAEKKTEGPEKEREKPMLDPSRIKFYEAHPDTQTIGVPSDLGLNGYFVVLIRTPAGSSIIIDNHQKENALFMRKLPPEGEALLRGNDPVSWKLMPQEEYDRRISAIVATVIPAEVTTKGQLRELGFERRQHQGDWQRWVAEKLCGGVTH